MKKHFSGKSIAAIGAALIIVIIALIAIGTGSRGGFVTRIASGITKPIRIAGASIAGEIESLYGYMYKYDSLVEENQRLSVEIAELRQNEREYNEVLEENERFRALFDLKSRHSDYVFETASVMSWSSSNWESSFTISKGSSNSDVEVGDAVITEAGMLVGQVMSVDGTTSKCRSIVDTGFSASAFTESSSDIVVAKGDFVRMRQGKLAIEYISESTHMYTGDTVMTSGKGEVFPRGLLIGYVSDMDEDISGLGMTATVEPAADLGDLMNVFIITDFKVTE